jgi:hypothetical protein
MDSFKAKYIFVILCLIGCLQHEQPTKPALNRVELFKGFHIGMPKNLNPPLKEIRSRLPGAPSLFNIYCSDSLCTEGRDNFRVAIYYVEANLDRFPLKNIYDGHKDSYIENFNNRSRLLKYKLLGTTSKDKVIKGIKVTYLKHSFEEFNYYGANFVLPNPQFSQQAVFIGYSFELEYFTDKNNMTTMLDILDSLQIDASFFNR